MVLEDDVKSGKKQTGTGPSAGAPNDSPVAATWPGFLEAVRKARRELGDPPVIWYRGQSREEWRLTPSLLRHKVGRDKEEILFNEYERSATRFHDKRTNDWELLVDMQHYGIPTRLMDWTDVLGVALAFTLYDIRDDRDNSAFYVLDPVGLNKLSGLDKIKRAANDSDFKYKSIYWYGQPLMPALPIAIDCVFQNDRIAAQSGSFTVHGTNLAPIDEQASKVIRKIILASSAKPEAREFLEYANLNPFSIYPDMVGMARHIVRKHLE